MEAANRRRSWIVLLLGVALLVGMTHVLAQRAMGQEPAEAEGPAAPPPSIKVDFVQLFHDGGTIGYIICVLSLALVALAIEHLLTIRRGTMIPRELPEEAHRQIAAGQYKAAEEACQARPSLLSYILLSGLKEVGLGYDAVEKAMEDAAAEQSARLLRKIEYLSVIGSVATMLGLLGTVWGMILAFMEFERKANPQISELAPGVYKALVTTLQGLIVAIPANILFAFFRNRIDELVAQTALMAEHIFADFKRSKGGRQPLAQRPRANPSVVPVERSRTAPGEEG